MVREVNLYLVWEKHGHLLWILVSPICRREQGHKAVTFKGPEDAGRLGGMEVSRVILPVTVDPSVDVRQVWALKAEDIHGLW